MSTKIQDTFLGKDFLEIGRQYDGEDAVEAEVRVVGRSHGMDTINVLSRSDFLAAVATECNVRIVPADAIVIERGELPEVTPRADGNVMCDGIVFSTSHTVIADDYREIGARALAVAEYLDANPPTPPVDEVQVLLISEALADTRTAHIDLDAQALRLYLAGVRVEASK